MDFDKYIENQRLSSDLQEKKVKKYCDECQQEIYEGNEFFTSCNTNYCEDCFDKIQDEEKRECRRIAGEDEC